MKEQAYDRRDAGCGPPGADEALAIINAEPTPLPRGGSTSGRCSGALRPRKTRSGGGDRELAGMLVKRAVDAWSLLSGQMSCLTACDEIAALSYRLQALARVAQIVRALTTASSDDECPPKLYEPAGVFGVGRDGGLGVTARVPGHDGGCVPPVVERQTVTPAHFGCIGRALLSVDDMGVHLRSLATGGVIIINWYELVEVATGILPRAEGPFYWEADKLEDGAPAVRLLQGAAATRAATVVVFDCEALRSFCRSCAALGMLPMLCARAVGAEHQALEAEARAVMVGNLDAWGCTFATKGGGGEPAYACLKRTELASWPLLGGSGFAVRDGVDWLPSPRGRQEWKAIIDGRSWVIPDLWIRSAAGICAALEGGPVDDGESSLEGKRVGTATEGSLGTDASASGAGAARSDDVT